MCCVLLIVKVGKKLLAKDSEGNRNITCFGFYFYCKNVCVWGLGRSSCTWILWIPEVLLGLFCVFELFFKNRLLEYVEEYLIFCKKNPALGTWI